MRVLFVSGELIAGDLAYRLKLEGCEVKLFIEHPEQKRCLDGFVEKTDDWKKELGRGKEKPAEREREKRDREEKR